MLTCDSPPFPSIGYKTQAEAQRAVLAQIDALPRATSNSYNDKFYRVFLCEKCKLWHWAVGIQKVPMDAPEASYRGQVSRIYSKYRASVFS
jgi:hypothetical protein